MNEIEMTRVPLFIGMTFGVLIGRFASISDELAPQVVMVSPWTIAGIFAGALISHIGAKRRQQGLIQER